MIDKLILGLPPIHKNQFTYLDVAKAFDVRINQIQGNSSLLTNAHDVDVFNFVMEGEICLSIEGKQAVHRKGEWFRIIAHQTHTVRTTTPVTLLELWRK